MKWLWDMGGRNGLWYTERIPSYYLIAIQYTTWSTIQLNIAIFIYGIVMLQIFCFNLYLHKIELRRIPRNTNPGNEGIFISLIFHTRRRCRWESGLTWGLAKIHYHLKYMRMEKTAWKRNHSSPRIGRTWNCIMHDEKVDMCMSTMTIRAKREINILKLKIVCREIIQIVGMLEQLCCEDIWENCLRLHFG